MKTFLKTNWPKINIRSKNEFAKRISGNSLGKENALSLINLVLKNFDDLWYDSKQSNPLKQKFVRAAIRKKELHILLKQINTKILLPFDSLVPEYFFGGLKSRNHIGAAKSLANGRGAVFLSFDVQRFFETVDSSRVESFFIKSGCSKRGAQIFSYLCCVPPGPKNSGEAGKVLARGFATSSRIALWCSLDNMKRIHSLLHKYKHLSPKLAIYVDDIGISLKNPTDLEVAEIQEKVIQAAEKIDGSLSLKIHRNKKKLKVSKVSQIAEHLGLRIGKTKVSFATKTRVKFSNLKDERSKNSGLLRKKIAKSIKGIANYNRQIQKHNATE